MVLDAAHFRARQRSGQFSLKISQPTIHPRFLARRLDVPACPASCSKTDLPSAVTAEFAWQAAVGTIGGRNGKANQFG